MIFAVVKSMCTKLQPSAGSKKAWTWAHRMHRMHRSFDRVETWTFAVSMYELTMNLQLAIAFTHLDASRFWIFLDLDASSMSAIACLPLPVCESVSCPLHARGDREASDCWVDPDGGILPEFLAHSSSAQPHTMCHNVTLISAPIDPSFFVETSESEL